MIDLAGILSSMSTTLLKTPLHSVHQASGGKLVEFAGYEMPVQYAGIIAESKAVRERAGMFDVSHMARLRFVGERVFDYLQWVTANDVGKLSDGLGQYSLLTNEEGGVVDDIIVYRLWATEYRMVVNAANHKKDVSWLVAQNKFDVDITDTTDSTAMIAVQGPHAAEILANLSNKEQELQDAPMFGTVDCEIAGCPAFCARSGYTGEDGFEVICAREDAEVIWGGLAASGVMPCGLGARDVLRVEAGLPLYGHELADDINPISAGLGWVIAKDKEFIGSRYINAARDSGTPKKLQGVKLNSKRLPTPGMRVYVGGEDVGEVSSGVYSPMLECGIAFAFIDANIKLNTPCELDMRGKMEPAMIVSKRFYKRQL